MHVPLLSYGDNISLDEYILYILSHVSPYRRICCINHVRRRITYFSKCIPLMIFSFSKRYGGNDGVKVALSVERFVHVRVISLE